MRKSWMLQVKASRLLPEGRRSELVRESASVIGKNTSIEKPSSRTSSLLRPSARIKNHIATLVPTLRVVMPFVTLRVTQRFFFFRWIGGRLRSPFRPSASHFDGAKVTEAPGSVSGPTSSGSFSLSLTSHSASSVPSRLKGAFTMGPTALSMVVSPLVMLGQVQAHFFD